MMLRSARWDGLDLLIPAHPPDTTEDWGMTMGSQSELALEAEIAHDEEIGYEDWMQVADEPC